ncbi:hypothetical protein GCM10010211_85360 [Streptomyces albospinus]|uniref:Uncharacterized protein n=1 Tax=Streptomyces albospinus TaxID=285515 RepID=A0ABQ2VPD9_9ACTN|nr:hypothetical protein GCM10010211_85360 [Streptomyces albospinus]
MLIDLDAYPLNDMFVEWDLPPQGVPDADGALNGACCIFRLMPDLADDQSHGRSLERAVVRSAGEPACHISTSLPEASSPLACSGNFHELALLTVSRGSLPVNTKQDTLVTL